MFSVLMKNRAPRVDTFMAALYSSQADEPLDEKIFAKRLRASSWAPANR
jgi:hypothetical protein